MNRDLLALSVSEAVPLQIRKALGSAKLIIEKKEVLKAVDQLAVRLSVNFHDRDPIILFSLKDAVWLFTTLTQRLVFPHISGYCEMHSDRLTATKVWRVEPAVDVQERDVLFLFGELTDGEEVRRLDIWARKQGALSISSVALVDRTNGSVSSKDIYSCFRYKEQRVFGCGLSYSGYGYSLPGLYAIAEY